MYVYCLGDQVINGYHVFVICLSHLFVTWIFVVSLVCQHLLVCCCDVVII